MSEHAPRVIVTGGRNYADENRVFDALDALDFLPEVVVHGACGWDADVGNFTFETLRGADQLAEAWAASRAGSCAATSRIGRRVAVQDRAATTKCSRPSGATVRVYSSRSPVDAALRTASSARSSLATRCRSCLHRGATMSSRHPLCDGDRVYYSREPHDTGTVRVTPKRVFVLWDDDCDDDVDPVTWVLDERVHWRKKRPSRREPYVRRLPVRVSAKRTTTERRSRP